MRFRNYSHIKVPKELWGQLAATLGLASILPQAVNDELGMYTIARSLRISVNRAIPRRHEKRGGLVGRYSFGHIRLYPCPKCSPGFLTFIFLHELCHAWLHQYHEQLYELYDSCGLCDEFEETGYRILSGVSMRNRFCWEFPLPKGATDSKLKKFRAFAEQYTSLGDAELRQLLDPEADDQCARQIAETMRRRDATRAK